MRGTTAGCCQLGMGSHGMRTHLASLTNYPLKLSRTNSRNPRLGRINIAAARVCNIVFYGSWYIIFFGFV
ncbi:MAG: hypothetical protein QOI59_6524 [Gammaproteobacteria bacterium]|jgi:hypothetical protein|nr:hypothetical protein [Gammaproteobacteria bacterium]